MAEQLALVAEQQALESEQQAMITGEPTVFVPIGGEMIQLMRLNQVTNHVLNGDALARQAAQAIMDNHLKDNAKA